MQQTIFIPTKEDLQAIIEKTVRQTVEDTLPEAIRKATRQEWLSTDDVMRILDCSRRHVQYLRDSNLIKYYQNGRKVRYHINDIEDFLNRGRVEAKEEGRKS